MPLGLARAGKNAVRFKPSGNLVHAQALQVFPVDAPDDFGLFQIDDQIAISVFGVAEKTVVIDLHFSLLVAVLDAELHVLRKALAFLLGKRGHDGKKYLSLGVHCVTGKTADRLGDDHVDVPGMTFFDHAIKLVTLFGVCTRDSVVREYAYQYPFRILGDVFGVVLNLGLIAGCLLITVSTVSIPSRSLRRATITSDFSINKVIASGFRDVKVS